MLYLPVFITLLAGAWAQNSPFALPTLSNQAPRAQVAEQYAKYFDLEGPSRQLVDGLVGPRPGIIPPRQFDIQGRINSQQQQQQTDAFNNLLQSFNQNNNAAQQPSDTFQSLLQSFTGNNQSPQPAPGIDLAALQRQLGINTATAPQTNSAVGVETGSSSIRGIPNIFPELPKAPIPQQQPRWIEVALGTLRGEDTSVQALKTQANPAQLQLPDILAFDQPQPIIRAASPQQISSIPQLPSLPQRPEVPTGGLGPLSAQFNQPQALGLTQGGAQQASSGFGNQQAPIDFNALLAGQQGAQGGSPQQQAAAAEQLANTITTLIQQQGDSGDGITSSQTGLVSNLMGLLGINPTPNVGGQDAAQLLGTFQSLLGGQQGGAGGDGGGVLGNVLYNALTDGVVQQQQRAANASSDNSTELIDIDIVKPIPFDAEKAAKTIGQNMNLLQQMLQVSELQPNSPLCTPKPQPVTEFNVDSFMGTWYQVLYSPPLAVGPCSMVAYKKLADVASGGPGTVFDTFEYTSEGTPFGKPRISSGYAIVRAPGQLIYRTTSNKQDVNVHVIATGPLNSEGLYEWAALSVNCNYPLHVFARDTVVYKQKYEAQVNAVLAQRGLINGFSRLLNVVAPVDNTLCSFPPTLFNIRG